MENEQKHYNLAAVEGIEPSCAGVKVPCLTTWRNRNIKDRYRTFAFTRQYHKLHLGLGWIRTTVYNGLCGGECRIRTYGWTNPSSV